ncbi:hypothetical protein FZO59_22155, partial [Lelliottia nimipressuralis]
NGNVTSKNTTFIADETTAEITDANLTVDPDNSPANGTAKNGVTATVTDATGNVVQGVAVSFTVAAGASITTLTGTTGADGIATAEVTSTTAGTYLVTATVNGNATSRNTTFVADGSTAEITDANLTVEPDNSPANGTAKNGVTAIVTDAQGNLVPGAAVSFTVADGASITTLTGTTGADGIATAEVTSTTAGTYLVTATVNGNATSRNTTFIADSSTAEITDANLTVDPDNSPANGTAKNGVTATVTDATGNVVPDAVVTFTVADGASITTVTGTTGADGIATAEVTSTTAGTYLVTATVNGNATSRNTNFVADGSTAEITDANLVIDPDGAAANGTAKNSVTATVTDATGNVVPGAAVSFTVAAGATLTTLTGTTGADGIATAEVTSLKAGSYLVTATVNGKATSKDTTFVADATTANLVLAPVDNEAEYYYAGYKAIFTATVVDGNDNLITDADFEVYASGTETVVATLESVSAGKGTISISDTAVGDVNLVVKLKGNAQVSDSAQVKFVADVTSAQILDADVYVENDGALAASFGSIVLTFTVKDRYGNPVPRALGWRHEVDFTPEGHSGNVSSSAASVDDGTGATVAITAKSGMAGEYRVALTIDRTNYIYRNIYYVGVMAPFEVFTDNALANGVDENRVGLHIYQRGTPGVIANTNVQFEADNNAILSSQNVLTDSEGYAYVTVTSKTAGPVNITARYAGNQQQTTSITFLQQTGEIAERDLIVDPDNAVADGRDKNVVTAFVKDTSGQPVVGEEVTFEVQEGPVLTPVTTTTGDDGKAVAEITSTKAGSFKVTATVNGKSTSKDTTFVADATTARMVLTEVNPIDSHPAGSKANFTASVQDANGNVFKDAEIEVSASGTETTEAEITGVSGGVANLFVTDTKVGEVLLTVKQKGNSKLSASEEVKFIADVASARVLESDFDTPKANAIANGVDEVKITASVTDQYGNPISVGGTSSTIPENGVRLAIDVQGSNAAQAISSAVYTENTITYTLKIDNATEFSVRPLINHAPVPGLNNKIVKFIPVLRELRANNNNQPADGTSPITLVVRLTYGMSDYASGYSGTVSFTATNGAVMSSNQVTTAGGGAGTGYAPVNVRSVNLGTSTVTATFEQAGITQQLTVDINFTNAATIQETDLVINPDNAKANGADKNTVTAIVTDGNGTPVAGEEVSFSVEDGPVVTVINGTSDAEGKAIAE